MCFLYFYGVVQPFIVKWIWGLENGPNSSPSVDKNAWREGFKSLHSHSAKHWIASLHGETRLLYIIHFGLFLN